MAWHEMDSRVKVVFYEICALLLNIYIYIEVSKVPSWRIHKTVSNGKKQNKSYSGSKKKEEIYTRAFTRPINYEKTFG
jgi:hypothetical protein